MNELINIKEHSKVLRTIKEKNIGQSNFGFTYILIDCVFYSIINI